MTVKYFEDLEVWKDSRILTNRIYSITKKSAFSKDFGLVDQIRRASVSVMSNIAEGFERGGNKEFIQFLYISKGSCGEVRAQLYVAYDQAYIDKREFEDISESARKLSIMIGNFIEYLEKSPYKGPKYKKPTRKSFQQEWQDILKSIKSDK